MSTRVLPTLLVTLPITLACIWAGNQALALRSAVEANTATIANPTAVAVVDVAKVIDKLNESANWRVQIEQIRTSANDEKKAREDDLRRLQDMVKDVTDLTKRQELIDEMALKQLRLEEWGKLKMAEIDREKSLMWRKLYQAIRDESKAVAESEGFQIVLVDDSNTEIRTSDQVNMPKESQVQQQIGTLRVLWADRKSVDITEKVIVRINNRT